MGLTDRFAARWIEWDHKVHGREEATRFLADAKDEDLLELLAGASERDRKYERDIITTEIQNRLATRNKELPEGADEVQRAAALAHETAVAAQKALHTAESILKASGDVELGTEVSASAYLNLDTTKLALEAADAHAHDVQAALMRSRVAERLVQDAADAAAVTAAKVEKGADRVADLGHEAVAEEARVVAKRIRETSEDVARKLREA